MRSSLLPLFPFLLTAPLLAGNDVVILTAMPGGPTCYVKDVVSKILATGLFDTVDWLDARSTTPSLAQLLAYDAVLTYSDGGGYFDPVAMGDILADYVDAGHGVVTGTFTNASITLSGRWVSGGYEVIIPAGQQQGTNEFLGIVYDPGHPVMGGVATFDGGSSSYRPSGTGWAVGATLIADWTDGTPLVVEGADPLRIDLGFFPPSNVCRNDFWNDTSDGVLLMANALLYVAVEPGGPIGTIYCSPANFNSTGQSAVISGFGYTTVADNFVTLTAGQLPLNVFGYFLNSDTQSFVPFPGGSKGNLCLGGGIGRHAKDIADTGTAGELVLDLDLTDLPRPGGSHSVLAGETWNFQCWFRDKVAGVPTSNFTDGLSITFQ